MVVPPTTHTHTSSMEITRVRAHNIIIMRQRKASMWRCELCKRVFLVRHRIMCTLRTQFRVCITRSTLANIMYRSVYDTVKHIRMRGAQCATGICALTASAHAKCNLNAFYENTHTHTRCNICIPTCAPQVFRFIASRIFVQIPSFIPRRPLGRRSVTQRQPTK